MSQPEITHDELSRILDSIEIPACPANLSQVMAEAQKDSPDPGVLARLIAADVGMAAAAIKLANSPLYRRGATLQTVPQAVSHLGTRNILCVVIAVSLRGSVGMGLPPDWLEGFWRRAGNAALAAGLVAKALRGVPTDTAYTHALFHDAAMPLMLKRYPDYLETLRLADDQGLNRAQAETDKHGCNHAQVSALLARNWGMQPVLIQAIRAHHDPDALTPSRTDLKGLPATLIAVTQVAEDVLDGVTGERTAQGHQEGEVAADYLGLSSEDLLDIREALEAVVQA